MIESGEDTLGALDDQFGFTRLAQSFAGLTGVPSCSRSRELGQPSLLVASSEVADISSLFPELRSWNGGRYSEHGLAGGCADEDRATAMMKAIAEAIERYAMTVIKRDEYIVATAEELGDQAIDWRLFPQCTEEEYGKTDQVVPFNPKRKMRWVSGMSLQNGENKYVPVALTHITTASRRAELFTLPISTGVAVHSDVLEATARAILEVVERDSIALTWLLSRELPRIEFDVAIPKSLETRFRIFRESHVVQHLFDATTDLGIPVVYGVMTAPGHPRVVNVVTAASDLDPFEACAKAMREAVSTRLAVLAQPYCPESPDKCFKLEHGAIYMGHPDRESAFDFLVNSENRRKISDMQISGLSTVKDRLDWIVGKLRESDIEVVVVELTTDDMRSHGLRAVRAVIPQLMPMSYFHHARFLKHQRLHDFAAKIGMSPLNTEDVNSQPQPFA